MSRFLATLTGVFISLCLTAQTHQLSITLIDKVSGEPVRDAHVFINNTTFGTLSDENGIARLTLPLSLSEDLLITHILYETRLIRHTQYMHFKDENRVELDPGTLSVPTLTINATRSKKWKKNYKKFKKAFLGAGKDASQCEIKNPEVLRFEETEGTMYATAVDLIEIQNPRLAYDILYLLNSLKIEADGSVEYLGRAQFIDNISPDVEKEVEEARYELYLKSPKYFFRSLIDNQLTENGFIAENVSYENGEFIFHSEFDRSKALRGPSDFGKYTVEFDSFLKVFNENSRTISFEDTGVRPGGLEASRFGTGGRQEMTIADFEISYLYKLSPYIILNQYGNILNTKDIKEYGFWADQKVASMLPFDYGNDYKLKDQDPNIESDEDKFSILKSLIYERNQDIKKKHLNRLSEKWENGMAGPLIELLRMSSDTVLINDIHELLKSKYPDTDNPSYFEWIQWLWKQGFQTENYYYSFKSEIYKHIDPLFDTYFRNRADQSLVNIEEVLWGGVRQDGIPPLRNPGMVKADQADYLDDNDVVFGIEINGDARAYPKRILAWHEFFSDSIGGHSIAGVYCTLCGTVIIYNQEVGGHMHQLGTSGFLFRSNKLMYDRATQSLWSTIDGIPVMGPLVNKDIVLKTFAVVTTDWKTWKSNHANTLVLDINTGYDRNYDEGEAYKEYFADDMLMFPVLTRDNRLKNKDEVVIVRLPGFKQDPLAIGLKYLKKKRWHVDQIGDKSFVITMDKSGAARAYATEDIRFVNFRKGILIDHENETWSIEESHLINTKGKKLSRIPSHNIFWFAWFNKYPSTRLVR